MKKLYEITNPLRSVKFYANNDHQARQVLKRFRALEKSIIWQLYKHA